VKNLSPSEIIKIFNERDRMGTLIGTKIVSLSKDECICEYSVSPEHFNPNGILHGGALFTAMDSSQGAFIHFDLDEKFQAAATGTATVKYLAPVRSGKIRIRTWLKRTEGRKLFVNSSATTEDGTEVATLEEVWIGILR
jgi:uncharacterized protein (TIGR00369 family)